MGLIQTAESIEQHVKAAYTALQQNGASLPEQRNLANLAGAIEESNLLPESYCIYGGPNRNDRNIVGATAATVLNNSNFAQNVVTNTHTSYTQTTANLPAYQRSSGWGAMLLQKHDIVEVKLDFAGKVLASPYSANWFAGSDTATRFSALKRLEILHTATIGSLCAARAFAGSDDDRLIIGEGVTAIGPQFLFQSPIGGFVLLPDGLLTVGTYFCGECQNIKGLYIPASVTPPTDTTSLSTVNANAPAVVNGIVLTGPGASAWKAALPNRTSSPYRKLILAQD